MGRPRRRLFLGSVSEGVVRHARCPVLVMRGGEGAWPPERAVLDDGSEEAGAAVELGATIYGAKGVLVQSSPSLMDADVEGSTVTARMLDDGGWFETRERGPRSPRGPWAPGLRCA